MSDDNYEFETADAGASLTYPMEAGEARKGGHLMLKGKPCKIVEISVSKTGKHGHAKCAFTGVDIFTNKKVEDMCPSTHNMECPNVKRVEFQLIDLDANEGTVSVLLENGDTKDDLNLPLDGPGGQPDECAKEMIAMFDAGEAIMCTVLMAMEQEKIVSVKKMQ